MKKKIERVKVPCDAGHRSAGHGLNDFNQRSIIKGMKVEFEHTRNPAIAKRIAADHLVEGSNYYELLEEMEKKLKNPLRTEPRVSKRCNPTKKRKKEKEDKDEDEIALTAQPMMKRYQRFEDIIR